MEYRHLGRSGLMVSEIAYGNWITHGDQVEEQAAARLRPGRAGRGHHHVRHRRRLRGRAGRGGPRPGAARGAPRVARDLHQGVLADRRQAEHRGLSRKHITESLHASLRRLQTDYVDLYQAHRYDHETPIEETMRAFDDLVRAGKVLYVGVSEWRAEEIAAALRVAGELGLDRIVSNQPQYNMLWRVIEPEVVPLCEKEGIGQLVFSPIAQGVLTGKYEPGAPPRRTPGPPREAGSGFIKRWLRDDTLAAVQRLRPLADEAGLSLAQLAVAWTLQNQNVSAAIVGATRPAQVQENVKAAGVTLDAGLMSRIDEALGDAVVRDPSRTASPPSRPYRCRARGLAGRSGPGSVLRVQAHRAVLGPGVVEQRDLVHPGREQRAPVLPEPALRVALAGEDRLLQLVGGDHGAVSLLVPPGPGHR